MKNIKWIVFDYGGVISLPQNKEMVAQICRLVDIPVTDFYPLYAKERHNYDGGQYEIDTYWKKNLAILKKNLNTADMRQLAEWDRQSWLSINEETIDYIREIKPMVHVGLLSNMPVDFFPYINNASWFTLCEARVLSFEEKICKPERKIFEILLQRTKAKPGEVLFIDDLWTNVQAAQSIGINSIQFIDIQTTRAEIEKNYLLVNT